MTDTLVLLAVRLKDTEDIPNLVSWQDWCHDLAPDDVNSVHALGRMRTRDLIKLEAHFLSHSSLLLVSLPIFIWDRLPTHVAFSFVGFIKSANLVLPSRDPRLEAYLNASTYQEDRTTVKTIEDQSEFDYSHQVGDEQKRQPGTKTALAMDYEKQGHWRESEKLFKEVVVARQSALGEEHPDTLASMANLASTYMNQGRWKEAEELGGQVMETRKRVLGEEHPSTLTSMINLAHTWKFQSRNEEAISLMEKCSELQQQIYGTYHPNTKTLLEALGQWRMGDVD